MKKFLMISLAAVLFVLGASRVNAMSEADLKKVLTQTIKINNTEISITADEKVLVEKYLNAYEVSEKDADYIAKKVEKAISILKAEGKTDLKKLSKSAKEQLKALVSDISSNTSVKATVTKGSLVVYKPDNSGVFAEVDKLVKQTGSEVSSIAVIASIAFVVTIAGACLVVKQIKESN